jgi:beta-1,4-N-acetylglucosaminyltransferase
MKLFKQLLKSEIVGISSSGGHLSELQSALPDAILCKVIYITSRDGRSQQSLKGKRHHFIIEPNGVNWKYIINFIQALFWYIRIKPLVIISTGSGMAVPFLVIGKIFGSKIIFIESAARIYTTSRTGKFIYKYADKFFIQYDTLLKYYPGATIGSLQ